MRNQLLATQVSLNIADVNSSMTRATPMDGANVAQINVIVQRFTATNLQVTAQLSLDGENFRDVSGSTITITGEGTTLATKLTGLTGEWFRLRYLITGASGLTIFGAGVNLSQQGGG